MPAQGFLGAQMAGNARLEMALRRAGVNIAPGRKVEVTEAADLEPDRLVNLDVQLVGGKTQRLIGL